MSVGRARLQQLAQHLRRLWLGYAGLALCIALSVVANRSVSRLVSAGMQERLASAAGETERAIGWRLESYLQALRATRGALVLAQAGDPHALDVLLGALDAQENLPALEGLALVERRGGRATVTRVAPEDTLGPLLGEELGREARALEAMDVAARTGRPAAVSRLVETELSGGVGVPQLWVFLPLDAGAAGGEPRRGEARGFLLGVLQPDALLQGLGTLEADIDYEVYEGRELLQENLLYDDDGLPGVGEEDSAVRLVRAGALPLVGTSWTLHFSTRPGFAPVGVEQQAPLAITLGGLLVGLLLFVIVATQTRARLAAEQLNRGLRESERSARMSKALAEQAERRAALLAEASRVLAAPVEERKRLDRVAHLMVPLLADGCIIDLVERDGTLRRAASASASLQALRDMAVRRRQYPPQWHGSTLETPHPPGAPPPWDAPLVVPLVARGTTLGALSLFQRHSQGQGGPGREDPAVRELAEDLARRIAAAVDSQRLVEEARAAVHLRDDFLVVAAHELKTPLTALGLQIAHVERLLEMPEPPLGQFRTKLLKVKKHLARLANLVNDLLDVSRISTGRLELHLEPVDLGKLAQEVVSRFAEQAGDCGASLSLRTAGGELTGRWDAFRLDQVLTNLVSNALKYGLGRPVSVTVEGVGGAVRVRVRDEGIGIADADRARIFRQFERAVSSSHYGGLGLGLFISQQIVEALGGKISVEGNAGQGSTFIVDLPRSGPPAGVAGGTVRSGEQDSSRAGSEASV